MRELAKIDHALSEQGSVAGVLGVEGSDLTAEVTLKYKYPIAKMVDPVMRAADALIDKIEAVIPGDQKAYAAKLKAEFRDDVVKLLSEAQVEVPAPQVMQDVSPSV